MAEFLPLSLLGSSSFFESDTLMAFRGNFEYTLDAKNRLTIPAKFRAELAAGVVVAKGLEPYAAIWTPSVFETFTRGILQNLNPLSQEATRMSRFFNAGSFDGELDANGRVMLQQPIIEHAGLGKEVVIVGNDDHLELWDRTQWATYEAELDATVAQTVEKIVNPA